MLNVNLDKHRRTAKQLDRSAEPGELGRRGADFRLIPHREFVERLRAALRDRGWTIGRGEYAVGNYYGEETELAGSIDFRLPEDQRLPGGIAARSIGFAISNGGRYAPRVFVGGRFVGGAGVCCARFGLGRHRDAAEDLPGAVRRAAEFAASAALELDRGEGRFTAAELSRADRDRILAAVGRWELLPWSRLSILDAGLGSGLATLWGLLRAFGEAARRNTPLDQLGQLWSCWRLAEDELAARPAREAG